MKQLRSLTVNRCEVQDSRVFLFVKAGLGSEKPQAFLRSVVLYWGNAPRGHLVLFRDIFDCHNWSATGIEQRPGIPLGIL